MNAPQAAAQVAPLPPGLLSTDEAAQYLRTKPLTLVAWRHKKQGPAYVKMGGHVRYRQGDLDAYIAQSVRTTVAA